MEEKNQKTVVAFIAGLLIGGLLVWVFSVAPDKKNDMGVEVEKKEQSDEKKSDAPEGESDKGAVSTEGDKGGASTASPTVVAQGAGSIVVEDQAAGTKVALGAVTMPVENGWIVVHEVRDSALGNILGAARYSTKEGLTPKEVELLRATESGKTYQVMLYSEDGDRQFNKLKDTPITTDTGARITDDFKAN